MHCYIGCWYHVGETLVQCCQLVEVTVLDTSPTLVFGEYVCWVVECVDFQHSHEVMCGKLLYDEMLDVDALCFS